MSVTTTTAAPTVTTVAPQDLPTSLWVIITGDNGHANQKYERVFMSGNVISDATSWDPTKPYYFGLGEPHDNLGDSLWFDESIKHRHGVKDYVGIWSLQCMPYTTSWAGNFFRKDLSASPNNENWNPVGIYTGINPWYEGPPDYTINPPDYAERTSAEVMHCDDCLDPTGWVLVNQCGGGYNKRDGCSTYIPKVGGKYCSAGNTWARQMQMYDADANTYFYLNYNGDITDKKYWPPGINVDDFLDFSDCSDVDAGFTKKCPTYFCASWTGSYEIDGNTWEFSLNNGALGTDKEGDLCSYGGWSISASFEDEYGDVQEAETTLCCGQNGVGLGDYNNAYFNCCVTGSDATFYIDYPGKNMYMALPLEGGLSNICKNPDTSYSQLLGYNIPFDLDGFGIACDCCRRCNFKRDQEGDIEYESCLGSLMGITLLDDPTTTPGPTTTTNEPPATTTTNEPPGTTTTAAPGPTTTTPPPSYVCVSNGIPAVNGTYEKADWQYNSKDQWSNSDGGYTRWVYYHKTEGWSISFTTQGRNKYKSPGDLGAENPWDVDSSAWIPTLGYDGVNPVNISEGECS